MQHEIRIDGFAFALRPVTTGDAERIVELRSNPQLSRYLHPVSANVSLQREWIQTYFSRPGDYYFAVERRGHETVEGFAGIYDLDPERRRAEWGRWVLEPGSLAAVESALLVYRVAFEMLELDEVYCRTVAENRSGVSFHDSCGLVRSDRTGFVELSGVRFSFIEHRLARGEWPEVKARLSGLAIRIAGRV
ncbi:MAG: GNAT family N-acetyltransferase [Syntrophobacteraceae bacterium]|jgi:RimJ/RimL family protein N-acetyltransferase